MRALRNKRYKLSKTGFGSEYMKWYAHSFYVIGSLGVFHAPAFAADKKSFRKIRYRKIPRKHLRSFWICR